MTLLRAGYVHVVDAHLQSYFDSIPHAPLRARVQSKVSDGRVLALLDAFLQQAILAGMTQWTPEEGHPARRGISPRLANLYLDPLDHRMADAGFDMVRYADNLVVLCRTPEDAVQALTLLQRWTTAAGLRLHPEKTRVWMRSSPEALTFLGYHFARGYRWPRAKSVKKLRPRGVSTTRRTHGQSLAVIIEDVNRACPP